MDRPLQHEGAVPAASVGTVAALAWAKAALTEPGLPRREHARMLAFLAWMAAVPLLLARHPTRRRIIVSLFRISAFLLVSEEVLTAPNLRGGTSAAGVAGWLVDAARVALVSRAVRLFLLANGHQLDLAAHLVVHTACLACTLPALPGMCLQPLMLGKVLQQRVSALHWLLSVPLAGIVPPGFPYGGQQAQCVAAASWLCIFLGWLLPAYLVIRRHWRDCPTRRLRQQGRQQQGRQQQGRQQQGAGAEPAADRLAAFCMEHVFLEDSDMPGARLQAWCIHAVLCWLAAAAVTVGLLGRPEVSF